MMSIHPCITLLPTSVISTLQTHLSPSLPLHNIETPTNRDTVNHKDDHYNSLIQRQFTHNTKITPKLSYICCTDIYAAKSKVICHIK